MRCSKSTQYATSTFPYRTTIREMHLNTQALRAQRFGEGKILIVIGADHYRGLVTGNVRAVTLMPKAMETFLGWTVQGPLP